MFYIVFGQFKRTIKAVMQVTGSKSVKHLIASSIGVYYNMKLWEKDGGTLWVHMPDGQQHKLIIQEEQIGG